MGRLWLKLHDVSNKLHLPDLPVWLVGILAFMLILRIPSFFEPYYYGDEMIYMTLGQGVRQAVPLYTGLHDNKPPLLYLTAAASGNLFWFKAMLAIFSIISIIFFFKILGHFFAKNKKLIIISTAIFALLTTLPFLEGNIANAENFMMLPVFLAIFILLARTNSFKNLFFAGALFGLATLYKVPAAFEAPLLPIYWLITSGSFSQTIKKTIFLFGGFVSVVVLSAIWFFAKGNLGEYIKAAFLQNIGYVSSWRAADVQKPFLVKNAPLLIRAFIVFVGLVILGLLRKRLSRQFIFSGIWLLLTLFAVTLSERPYPHYLLQAVAPISIFLGMFLAERTKEQALSVVPLFLAYFVPTYFHFWSYPVGPYYLRFWNFARGKVTKESYFSSFSPTTNRNYQIADFLVSSAQTNDRVFMYDPDSPTVYALSRKFPPIKYVVPYHITDYSSKADAAQEISKNPPKFIILTTGNNFPEITPLIRDKYIMIQQIGNANIYSRVDLAPGI